jgi:hypothetical protein
VVSRGQPNESSRRGAETFRAAGRKASRSARNRRRTWMGLTDGNEWQIYNSHAKPPVEQGLFRGWVQPRLATRLHSGLVG